MDLVSITKKILEEMGFTDTNVLFDADSRRMTIFITEGEWFSQHVADVIRSLEQILKIIIKKNNLLDLETLFIDINNYRKQRENLIIELAKAAAQKTLATKEPVHLPSMNSYERRLVHKELATRPDLKTESQGEGLDRHIIINVL